MQSLNGIVLQMGNRPSLQRSSSRNCGPSACPRPVRWSRTIEDGLGKQFDGVQPVDLPMFRGIKDVITRLERTLQIERPRAGIMSLSMWYLSNAFPCK